MNPWTPSTKRIATPPNNGPGKFELPIQKAIPQQPSAPRLLGTTHPEVFGLARLASTLWYLGYPDQALQPSQAALLLARQLAHPFGMTAALLYAVNIGVAYWLLVNLTGLASAAYQTFLHWGLAAGGSAAAGLLSPSRVQKPRSQIWTVPPPYSPSGIVPSKSP